MTSEPEQLPAGELPADPIEVALHELRAAERAGVFRPTRIDTRALMRRSAARSASHPPIFTLRRVAVAAAVLVAVSVWGWMFSPNTPTATATLSDCVTGPTDSLMADCRTYDYDADGDVDLADISSYQLAYASVGH